MGSNDYLAEVITVGGCKNIDLKGDICSLDKCHVVNSREIETQE